MNNKKNIDRLFQEKFKDFEVAPSDAMWNRISESLPKKKKKRRVIALWWQVSGIAAAIALLLTIGVTVFNSEQTSPETFPVVNTDETNPNSKNTPNSSSDIKQNELNSVEANMITIVDANSESKSKLEDSENETSQKTKPSNQLTTPHSANQKPNAVAANSNRQEKTKSTQKTSNLPVVSDKIDHSKVANQNKTNSTLKNKDKSELVSETERKSLIKKNLEDNKTVIAEKSVSKKQDAKTSITDNKTTEDITETEISLIGDSKQNSIENAIAETNKTKNEEEKEDDRNRWSVAPNVAPVYFNSLGQGSSLDKQFNENTKSSDVNMSYGIAGAYAISKKIKIRAGVNRVHLNQTTSDVFAYTGAETASRGIDAEFKNISFRGGTQHVSLISAKMMNRSSTPELFNTKIAGNIDQKFGFIEVPIEIEYRLLDQKFGINVIGGFSTFILSENEIYADVNGASTLIGEANNINNTSFSANFGLGMDYSLSKQWNINLEPTFKYQINTFTNTSGDFKPFFIGIYTGLSYKF